MTLMLLMSIVLGLIVSRWTLNPIRASCARKTWSVELSFHLAGALPSQKCLLCNAWMTERVYGETCIRASIGIVGDVILHCGCTASVPRPDEPDPAYAMRTGRNATPIE